MIEQDDSSYVFLTDVEDTMCAVTKKRAIVSNKMPRWCIPGQKFSTIVELDYVLDAPKTLDKNALLVACVVYDVFGLEIVDSDQLVCLFQNKHLLGVDNIFHCRCENLKLAVENGSEHPEYETRVVPFSSFRKVSPFSHVHTLYAEWAGFIRPTNK